MGTSIVIVNWNSGNLLRACVQSLLAATPDTEIVVIDNASTDRSVEELSGFRDHLHLVRNSVNLGFAAAVNQGFKQTDAPYVLILNPDIRAIPGSVELLANFLDTHPRAGAVGGYVNENYLPRPIPSAAALMKENLGFAAQQKSRETHGAYAGEQPAAAALMIRRDAFEDVGGFDERFYPAWYEDVDFSQRLKGAGWDICFAPDAEFEHEGGYSAVALGPKAFAEAYYHNQLRYAQKHFSGAAQVTIRASIAAGMLVRMAVRPRNASAYMNVLRGALGRW